MKKKMAALLAALMVLSCGTLVSAAPSVTAEDLAKDVKATAASGVEVKLEKVEEKVVADAFKAAEAKSEKSEVVALMEVSVPEGTGKVQITFDVDGVVKGDNVYLLHFNGTKWEVIHADKVEDGKVTATFTSLSPVAIVKVAAGETLPKTGVTFVLPVAAMICAAGAVGCGRKAK